MNFGSDSIHLFSRPSGKKMDGIASKIQMCGRSISCVGGMTLQLRNTRKVCVCRSSSDFVKKFQQIPSNTADIVKHFCVYLFSLENSRPLQSIIVCFNLTHQIPLVLQQVVHTGQTTDMTDCFPIISHNPCISMVSGITLAINISTLRANCSTARKFD